MGRISGLRAELRDAEHMLTTNSKRVFSKSGDGSNVISHLYFHPEEAPLSEMTYWIKDDLQEPAIRLSGVLPQSIFHRRLSTG